MSTGDHRWTASERRRTAARRSATVTVEALRTGRTQQHNLGEVAAGELMFEAYSEVSIASAKTAVALKEARPLDVASGEDLAVKSELGGFDRAGDRAVDVRSALEIDGALFLADFVFFLPEDKQNQGVALAVVECIALPATREIRDRHFGLLRNVRVICILAASESGRRQNQDGRQQYRRKQR